MYSRILCYSLLCFFTGKTLLFSSANKYIVLTRLSKNFVEQTLLVRKHKRARNRTKPIFNASVCLGVLFDILPVRVVLPVAAGQSALRPSAVQSNRTGLLGRSAVGLAVRAITSRTIGKSTTFSERFTVRRSNASAIEISRSNKKVHLQI